MILLMSCTPQPIVPTVTTTPVISVVLTPTPAPYDVRFIDSMIAHHEMAVMMSKQVLEGELRPEVQLMAQNIVQTQQSEINQMRAWRKAWYPDVPLTTGLDLIEMAPTPTLTAGGDSLDQWYVAGMILHHEDAVVMAQDAVAHAEHTELRELAGKIIETQTIEIETMQGWEREWGQP